MVDVVDAIERTRQKAISRFYGQMGKFKNSKEALSWGFSEGILLPSEMQELKYYFETMANEIIEWLMDMEAIFGSATTKEERIRALSLRIREERAKEVKKSISIGIIFVVLDLIMFVLIFLSIKHAVAMGAIISDIFVVAIMTAVSVGLIFKVVQSLVLKELDKEAENKYEEYLNKRQTLIELKELIELIKEKRY